MAKPAPPKKTGVVCPKCFDSVAVVEQANPDRVTLSCPACGNRWSTKAP